MALPVTSTVAQKLPQFRSTNARSALAVEICSGLSSMTAKAKKWPQSTSTISYGQVNDLSSTPNIAQFSPDGAFFALVILAVDKHRLRIYNGSTGVSIVEQTLDSRVSTLKWMSLDLLQGDPNVGTSPKKRKKRAAATGTFSEEKEGSKSSFICLGLSNGSVVLFSLKVARVVRTLTHPSSLSSVIAVASGSHPAHIWSSSVDGTLRLWHAGRNELMNSWKSDVDGMSYSALCSRPSQGGIEMELLVAAHSMRLLSIPLSKSTLNTTKPIEIASFAGHASIVNYLAWDTSHRSQFISTAIDDRVVNLWTLPKSPSTHGNIVANIPLDGFARDVRLSPTMNKSILSTVSATGKVALFELPSNVTSTSKVITLSPCSIVSASSKKGDEHVAVVACSFLPTEPGRLRIARLTGGIKPIIEDVQYLNDNGDFISEIALTKDIALALAAAADTSIGAPQKRYTELCNVAVTSGVELGIEREEPITKGIDGDLDVDLAELSLGQRLATLSGTEVLVDENVVSDPESDTKLPARELRTRRGKDKDPDRLPTGAQSLARTLIQALHSSDTRLLESCLLHTDQKVVMNTVRRLPSQLTVPLLNACVERLGRGVRAGTGKGGGGGASAQRGSGLVKWVRAVLVVHTAYLMTLPDLVTRLAGLHATIAARLALRDPLLALNGRLDMVLSQVELRASSDSSRAQMRHIYKEKKAPTNYVEGESSESSEEAEGMEIEGGDDAGSIEDVELGGVSEVESGEDASEQEDVELEEEEEEEEEEDSEGSRLNGFIDDEAEEDWGDEDSAEDEFLEE